MDIGVYQIKVGDLLYVGSTTQGFERRWYRHKADLKKGVHHSQYLQRIYNKYGLAKLEFSILQIVENKEDVLPLEQKYIDELNPALNTYKIAGSSLGSKRTPEQVNKMKITNSVGIDACKEWHSTPDGNEWHKQHYEKMKDCLYIKAKYKCEYCGIEFETNKKETNKFCSNACKSAYRRKSNVDDVIMICQYCGVEFYENKYRHRKTCSHACANKMNAAIKRSVKNC